MNSKLWFAAQRAAVTIPFLLFLTVFVFLIVHLAPGNPVQTMLGFNATPANVAAVTRQLGLDRPLAAQYVSWLDNLAHGNLGEDLLSHAPVVALLRSHLPVTLELSAASMILGIVLGVGGGAASVLAGRIWQRIAELISIIGISTPAFWLAIMFSLLFAGYLHIFPPSGYVPLTASPFQNAKYMTLPVLTLAIVESAYLSRVTRSIVGSLLRGQSIVLLKAKGLSMRAIIFKHVLRQASAPIVTMIGIDFGILLGGAIIVENIFGLPGLGSLLVSAVEERDYTVVQGCVLLIAFMFTVVTFLTDLIVTVLDPRGKEVT
jgi:peptide/nickel transport system permease protein